MYDIGYVVYRERCHCRFVGLLWSSWGVVSVPQNVLVLVVV